MYPQCGGCRVKGVKVKHSRLEKQCAAASGRTRHRVEEELLQQRRMQERPVAPAHSAGEDTIAGVVGEKKQGNLKFILRESEASSELCDQCTWQPGEFDFAPSVLLGEAATFRLRQTSHSGVIKKRHRSEPTVYYTEFNSRRHTNRWVNLDLPRLVGNGEYSY
jgi:hypothetical protein